MANSEQKIDIHVVPQPVFKIGDFTVTDTMLNCAVAVGILLLFALIVRIFFIPRWNNECKKKSGFRIFLEYIVKLFDSNAKTQTGANSSFTGPFYFACSAFICIATLLEMFSMRPATSDLSLTLVFGLMSFLLILFYGFKENRARRLLHYLNPLYIISDCVVPVSIALRMFGSVFCGYLIMHLIYALLPWWLLASGIVGALGNVMFTMFHALIQSYVFMFLSLCLINESSEKHTKHAKPKVAKTEEISA